jgi:hypothetical protein
MSSDDLDDGLRFMGYSTFTWFWIVLLTTCTIGFFLKMEPYFTQQETQITRESNAYVTSKQTALRSWMLGWQDLEVQKEQIQTLSLREAVSAQQKGIVRQMKEEADTISPGYIPMDIKTFLASH